MCYPKVLFSLLKSRADESVEECARGRRSGRVSCAGASPRQPPRRALLRSSEPSRAPAPLPCSSPLLPPELSFLLHGLGSERAASFWRRFDAKPRRRGSVLPKEFVSLRIRVRARRELVYIDLPPPSLFKTKPLCVAFVTLIPILPTPGAQADELPRNTKF